MSQELLVISVRPRFAEGLFSGTKSVELRRTRPRVKADSRVLVYATSPQSSLAGILVVEKVLERSPRKLWSEVRSACGLTRQEFFHYFRGAPTAFGIVVAESHRFAEPIPLARLQKAATPFRPPQCYHYVHESLAQAWAGLRLPVVAA